LLEEKWPIYFSDESWFTGNQIVAHFFLCAVHPKRLKLPQLKQQQMKTPATETATMAENRPSRQSS
jgi:hypothetical protein